MVLSRRWSLLLIAVAVWSWLIWPRFLLAIWDDDRSWTVAHGSAFFWIHVGLIAVSLAFGTAVGVLGILGVRASRHRDR
ncbi:hypothetical protein OHA72_40245 [Dactylosporangium sp. NBC_01737]|uniref:SCO4848 family membrane protein n=1 Tax=Dactylosporangium sp. NBC_01737 TaxID=2975959 RepID=UPI002E10E78B|nr:hypothetical protein OHA72_40245 [Dactylosporangium sp. NBC_01737]